MQTGDASSININTAVFSQPFTLGLFIEKECLRFRQIEQPQSFSFDIRSPTMD